MDEGLSTTVRGMDKRRFGRLLVWGRRYGSTLWTLVVLASVAAFGFREREAMGRVTAVAARAIEFWSILGLGVVMLAATALASWLILARLHHPLPWYVVARASTEGTRAGAVSPVSTPAAALGFTRVLLQHGVSVDEAFLVFALNSALGVASFVAFLVSVVIVLAVEHRLSSAVLAGSALLAATMLLTGVVA
jgi:hypothetical protein